MNDWHDFALRSFELFGRYLGAVVLWYLATGSAYSVGLAEGLRRRDDPAGGARQAAPPGELQTAENVAVTVAILVLVAALAFVGLL